MNVGTNRKPLILGLGASLRSARWGEGAKRLVEQLYQLDSENALNKFLERESNLHLENFLQAGRRDGLSFDEIYKKLKKAEGDKGLCNSEVILSASLWSALKEGCDIEFRSIAEFFTSQSKKKKNIEQLRSLLLRADGLILSTPVYFGDHSSLAGDCIRFITQDDELSKKVKGMSYAGLAVGAKRNGGQETTLVYQIIDMLNIDMLAVGNDSETTSQYGGTSHAGDVGTAWKDYYGIWTSMGVGRRVAKVSHLLLYANNKELKSKLRVGFWLTQDYNGFARKQIEELVSKYKEEIDAYIFDVSKETMHRCLACDICPKSTDDDLKYRCLIQSPNDFFKRCHESILNVDAIVPVAYVPNERIRHFNTSYQVFNERLRYLRRGDYVFTDYAVAPFVFEEIGANDCMRVRMITSMIRQHTIMTRPIVGHILNGEILNFEQLESVWKLFLEHAKRLTVGRLVRTLIEDHTPVYNPVGYVLSADKEKDDNQLQMRYYYCKQRQKKLKAIAEQRVAFQNEN